MAFVTFAFFSKTSRSKKVNDLDRFLPAYKKIAKYANFEGLHVDFDKTFDLGNFNWKMY